MNMVAKMGDSSSWILRAAGTSPDSASSSISWMRSPTTCAATETTPTPPRQAIPNVAQSSPEYTSKPGGASRMSFDIPSKSPVESFTPTMLGTSASFSSVSCSMRVAVRPGMLYTSTGSSVDSATLVKCATRPRCGGLL